MQKLVLAAMIVFSMNGNDKTRRLWADKVALLCLFVVALLIARFIVVSRSSVAFSEPIKLNYGGLSVSIPTGNGWQGDKQWSYQQNAFTLGSFLTVSLGNVSAIVSCQYRLAPAATARDVLFEERASASGGVIVKTGRIEMGRPAISFAEDLQSEGVVAMDWVHIKNQKVLSDTFFGIAQLPNNHQLDIEVYQAIGDTDLAENIFKSVTKSLKFVDAHPLENGGKVVSEIKRKGLNSFLSSGLSEESPSDGKTIEAFFLIKDAGGRHIGFTMEVLGSNVTSVPETSEVRLNILAGSFYYIRRNIRRGRYDHRQAALFQSDNNLSEFLWKSETHGPAGRSGAEMVLGKDGVMTVRKFDRQFEEKHCRVSSIAIPDVLSELLFDQMLESNQNEIFVDIIGADSKIIPTLISRTEQSGPVTSFAGKEAAYVFTVEFLDGRDFSEQVYLDDEKQVSGRLLQQENTYTLERTSAENILHEFPEQGSYILQRKDEVFEQSQQ